MQTFQLLTPLLVLSLCTAGYGQLSWSSVTTPSSQHGEGTFYGEGQDNQGTCSFSANFANTNDLPWSTGTSLTVALNDAQFADSAACGMCIRFRGTGSGLGTTPIPSTWTNALVNNRCPECSPGDVDLAAAGDGRWKIEWYAVPCEVGSSPLQYSIVVSSYYWFSMVVSNTRVPITGVSVNIGGSWLQLKRTNNNQWAYYNTNGPWQSSFPMGVRVTSIDGQTVQDSITGASGNAGTQQFSSDGSGSTAATAATTPATTTASAVPSPPPAASTTPVPPPVAQSPPPAATPVTAPPTSSAPLADGGFYIENYQQCGGSGGACNNKPYTAAPCADAAWQTATCRSPSFACVRASADLYTCVPATAGSTNTSTPSATPATPPGAYPPVTPPTPVTSATPPTVASAPPTPVTSPAADTSRVTPAAQAVPPITDSSQSGIFKTADLTTSTYTASNNVPPATATPSTTPAPTTSTAASPPPSPTTTSTAASSPPSPTTTSTATSAPPSPPTTTSTDSTSSGSGTSTSRAALAIAAGGQCGGTSSCDPVGVTTDKVTCNNGPWSGAYCPNSYECRAAPGPLVWTCMASGTQTAGRRLLS